MRIYVIRHGESEDDVEDAYGGVADWRLTDTGRQQAREVAGNLRHDGIERVYSSPLQRATETAEIICAALGGVELQVVHDLQERNSYGVLSGVSKVRAAELFGHVMPHLTKPPGYSDEPLLGAEDFASFLVRVRTAWDGVIIDALRRGVIRAAIVTHGKFTRALFEHVLHAADTVDPALSAVQVLDYEPALVAVRSGTAEPAEQ